MPYEDKGTYWEASYTLPVRIPKRLIEAAADAEELLDLLEVMVRRRITTGSYTIRTEAEAFARAQKP